MLFLISPLKRIFLVKILICLSILVLPAFAELPNMMIGVIPEKSTQTSYILQYFRSGIFICLIALCFKGLKAYNKMSIAQSVWLATTAILSLYAHNLNLESAPDFSYFSFSLFLAVGSGIYASAEYLKRHILNHNKSSLFDNIIHGFMIIFISMIAITGIKNSSFSSNTVLYMWTAVIIIGSVIAIYNAVEKSIKLDLVILGWIAAQIGLIVALSIGINSDAISVITSITAWCSVIIGHCLLAGLTFLKFHDANAQTMLQTQAYDSLSNGDCVSLIVDKSVFRINHHTQKIILNDSFTKMLRISAKKTEFSIDDFKNLITPEYQPVIDKIVYDTLTAPEIIKFHACQQAGFIQPLQLRNDNHSDEADILFLYQEMTGLVPVSKQTTQKNVTDSEALLDDYMSEFTQSTQKTSLVSETHPEQASGRKDISDVMYFINQSTSEILKNSQITGDYTLILLQIKHYDDWQVILGVSQTYQVVQYVTQKLEKALGVFDNLVVKNFNGDIIGIFCHTHSSESEIERLKMLIHKQFETPVNIDTYNLFVNFDKGMTKISVSDHKISMNQEDMIHLITDMIDSSKRLLSMNYDVSLIDVRTLSFPQGSNIIQLSTDLRYAPERGQISAYYAPIINLHKGVTVGFDISPIWKHPDFDIINGDLLSYLSERCNIHNTINRLVIAKSIEGMIKLSKSAQMPIMNFTISRKLVLGTRIDEEITNLCDALKISPSVIRLEFSADCLGDNPRWLGNVLTDLKSIGVTTVLSGFGSAKGQLSALSNLAFDRVIIDSDFADNILHNERKFFALKSLVTMLHNMAIKADIKGITEKSAFKLLINAGISDISGPVFGEPMPVQRAANLLSKTQKIDSL